MNFDLFIFPAPRCSYKDDNTKKLIWKPKIS
jgi:hypothetical protein